MYLNRVRLVFLRTLQPGQEKVCTFALAYHDFSSYYSRNSIQAGLLATFRS